MRRFQGIPRAIRALLLLVLPLLYFKNFYCIALMRLLCKNFSPIEHPSLLQNMEELDAESQKLLVFLTT